MQAGGCEHGAGLDRVDELVKIKDVIDQRSVIALLWYAQLRSDTASRRVRCEACRVLEVSCHIALLQHVVVVLPGVVLVVVPRAANAATNNTVSESAMRMVGPLGGRLR